MHFVHHIYVDVYTGNSGMVLFPMSYVFNTVLTKT